MGRQAGTRRDERARSQAIEAAWFGCATVREIAEEHGVTTACIYMIWARARAAQRIPTEDRALRVRAALASRIREDEHDDGGGAPRDWDAWDGRPSTSEDDPLLAALRRHHTLAEAV